ncbi:hypothetical protein ACIA8G_27115 [Lentzea sp. NPDC051213]|uniref:hypothetical protein n=1 Tax=Lentzea sp. NPDC051213 TaxID=3364126 RepID=UPI0037AA3BD3
MRFTLTNDHESPVEIIAEQADLRRSLVPGQDIVVDWTWSGFADLTIGSGWISLSTPPGGRIVVVDSAADAPLPGESTVSEFWIHNATEAELSTLWEPWGQGDIPPDRGPMRVEWTDHPQVVEISYEPGLVVIWDLLGGCRAWQPDGAEVLTAGSYVCDTDGKYDPAPVPGWPRPADV